MADESVDTILTRYERAINQEITRWIGAGHPSGLYDMMRYQLDLVGGDLECNRHPPRPGSLLCVLTCQAVGGSEGEAIGAAAAIELLCGWFQIHRDIEEQTPASRAGQPGPGSRPALWTRSGYPQAINTGDGMFSLAGQVTLAAVDNPEIALALTRELTDTSLSHMEGRHRELALRGQQPASWRQASVTPETYLETIELTAGAVMGYSAWAGAVIGGAGEDTGNELRRFGAALGVAWRVRDEITSMHSREPLSTDTEPKMVLASLLDSGVIERSRDAAIAALHRANLGIAGSRLEAFARELAPL